MSRVVVIVLSYPKYCTRGKQEKKDEVSVESPAATLLTALFSLCQSILQFRASLLK
jgi:hypothetical protein